MILLGQRYGWLPLPEQISAFDASTIISQANNEEKDLFNKWYLLDINAILEPVYILQPRHGDYLDYACYNEEVEKKLFALFDRSMSPDKIVYHTSATEQEINAGALSVDEAKKHVVAYFRELGDIPQIENGIFTDNQENYFAVIVITDTLLNQMVNLFLHKIVNIFLI